MQKVLIIGAGKGGTALLQILMKTKLIRIIAVVDQDPEAQEFARSPEIWNCNLIRLETLHN